jgi:HSP20 family protein
MMLTRYNKANRFPTFGGIDLPSLFDEINSFPTATKRGLSPAMDVSETESTYKVIAELPGMTKEDIKVELENDILTIAGEKKSLEVDEGEKSYRKERVFGSFTRKLRFTDIDNEKVSAEYKNGVLEVTVAKAEEAKPKQISIG